MLVSLNVRPAILLPVGAFRTDPKLHRAVCQLGASTRRASVKCVLGIRTRPLTPGLVKRPLPPATFQPFAYGELVRAARLKCHDPLFLRTLTHNEKRKDQQPPIL